MKIQKVVAAVIQKDDKVLIAQRAKKDVSYGKWEFPGGKMEQGETEQECLKREFFEEFGIHAVKSGLIFVLRSLNMVVDLWSYVHILCRHGVESFN